MYVCETIFQDIPLDNQDPGTRVAKHIFTRENISCKPYYTLQSYKKICVRCGRLNGLQSTNPEFYPQCNRCNDPPVKRRKKCLPPKMILKAKRNKRLCCKLVIMM